MHVCSDWTSLNSCARFPLRNWLTPRGFSRSYLLALAVSSSLCFGLAWCSAWFGWLLFVAVVPLLLLVEHVHLFGKRGSFVDGFPYLFLACFLWNAATLWWLVKATVLGFLFVALCNAGFLVLPFYLHYRMGKALGKVIGWVGLAAAWLVLEYAHLSWESWELSFPWLNLGNGLAGMHPCIQWYAFTGTLGGTLWILLVNVLLHRCCTAANKVAHGRVCLAAFALPLALSLAMYGAHVEQGRPVEAVVVQPNFDSYTEKAYGSPHFVPVPTQIKRLLALTRQCLTPHTQVVLWPETAVDFWMEEACVWDYRAMQPIAQFVQAHPNLNLIFGASTVQGYGRIKRTETAQQSGTNYVDYFNSVLHVKPGLQLDIYHKNKRLPGGECIPYARYWPETALQWLHDQCLAIGGLNPCLARGNGSKIFATEQGIRIAPINCYESLYGAFAGSACQQGAALFAVVTNDGWWDDTPIYQQHFQYSRLLAIAHRRSLMRASNTGISGCINQRGDALAATNRLEPAALRHAVSANDRTTFYSRHGDWVGQFSFWVLLFLLAVLLAKESAKSPAVKTKGGQRPQSTT